MISSILKFKINKKDTSQEVLKKLIFYINKFVLNKNINDILKNLSRKTDIPVSVLSLRAKQQIYRDFDFKVNKFLRYEIIFLPIDIVKYFLLTIAVFFSHILFAKHNPNKKLFDVACDNVFNQVDVDRYSKFPKYLSKICYIGTFKPIKKLNSEYYFLFSKIKLGASNIPLKTKFYFILFGFKLILISIIFRVNLVNFMLHLIYDILKSSHIFTHISAKYYITQKFYSTSTIMNFYFKKSGGKIYSCTQKNILNMSLSGFVFADVMFTLGLAQGKICNTLGGKVNKFHAVGSLFMEDQWFSKKKDLNLVPKSDILILGINTLNNNRHYINNVYENNYYFHFLNWIVKLREDFPEKKIILKHHANYLKDKKEKKILDKSNIKVIINNRSTNGSYAYAFKSKLIFSFSSTMIVELLGHKKNAFYVDPGMRGNEWFKDIKNISKIRIGNYNKLKEYCRKDLKKVNIHKDKDNYCLNSKSVTRSIVKYLKKC